MYIHINVYIYIYMLEYVSNLSVWLMSLAMPILRYDLETRDRTSTAGSDSNLSDFFLSRLPTESRVVGSLTRKHQSEVNGTYANRFSQSATVSRWPHMSATEPSCPAYPYIYGVHVLIMRMSMCLWCVSLHLDPISDQSTQGTCRFILRGSRGAVCVHVLIMRMSMAYDVYRCI